MLARLSLTTGDRPPTTVLQAQRNEFATESCELNQTSLSSRRYVPPDSGKRQAKYAPVRISLPAAS
jgi:hypothetical protein